VRVTPGAPKARCDGVWGAGAERLALRVTASPDKGKANAGVCDLVARLLGLPTSAVSVSAGHASRLKTLAIVGDGEAIAARLAQALKDSK
jgi:hypothetical protein